MLSDSTPEHPPVPWPHPALCVCYCLGHCPGGLSALCARGCFQLWSHLFPAFTANPRRAVPTCRGPCVLSRAIFSCPCSLTHDATGHSASEPLSSWVLRTPTHLAFHCAAAPLSSSSPWSSWACSALGDVPAEASARQKAVSLTEELPGSLGGPPCSALHSARQLSYCALIPYPAPRPGTWWGH